MPQKPVRRAAPRIPTPARRSESRVVPLRLVPAWAGWTQSVDAFIEERGPQGQRKFGQGQADNYRWILQGERCRIWRNENRILVPEDVTPEIFEKLKRSLLDQAGMKPGAVQQYVKNTKTFLRWCQASGFAIDAAALAIDNVDQGDEEAPDPFSAEEIRALVRAAKTPDRKFLVRFLWRVGLRVGELERANADDFDRDVHGFLFRVPEAARKSGPTAGRPRARSVPLDTKDTKFGLELRRYITRDRGTPYCDPADPVGSSDAAHALFLNDDGRRFRTAGIQSYFRRLGAEAGFNAHPHRFRHTFGTWCARRGMNTFQIMAVGGWRPPQAATRYIKFANADAVRFFAETGD